MVPSMSHACSCCAGGGNRFCIRVLPLQRVVFAAQEDILSTVKELADAKFPSDATTVSQRKPTHSLNLSFHGTLIHNNLSWSAALAAS